MAAPAEIIRQLAATDTLAAMITPAVLISACGTLGLSTSNRLGRVVDRVRSLSQDVEQLNINSPDATSTPELLGKRRLVTLQLQSLSVRLYHLQNALTALYLAIGLLVLASLTVGLRAALLLLPDWLPTTLGLLGASALFFASLLLVLETRLAVRSSLLEMEHVNQILQTKFGEALSLGPNWRSGS
jgi:hypothetical protein